MTDLFFDKEARDKLLKGAEKLYNAVKTTMGPRGRNVVIGKRGFGPTVTHDGVTVAQAVHVKDEGENVGAELIKEAASKLNDVAGDGTTTVSVLTYHILKAAADLVEKNDDINPMILAREVEAALEGVIQYLEQSKLPADDLETLTKIATISSGNEEIGKVVAETVHAVGATGTVDVEAVARLETTSEMASGFQLDRGWISPYMITKENTQEAIYDNPPIIILHRKIYSFREILPILQKLQEQKLDLAVIVAQDIEGDALPSLLLNNEKGVFRTLVIKAPGVGAQQRRILDDLAHATGGTVIAQDTVSLDQAGLEHIGRAKRVIASREKTTFIDVEGDLEGRIKQLGEQIKGSGSEYERELLEKRQAALAGKVAKIRVGGQTETEIEEKKFRVDDAVAATKAALAEGILPGGGVVLYHAPVDTSTNGGKLLKAALQEPFRQLITNSGLPLEACEKWVSKIDNGKAKKGFNVKTGERVDLLEAGIVDPFTVTKQALATAVSLGVVGMTTGALIVEEEK